MGLMSWYLLHQVHATEDCIQMGSIEVDWKTCNQNIYNLGSRCKQDRKDCNRYRETKTYATVNKMSHTHTHTPFVHKQTMSITSLILILAGRIFVTRVQTGSDFVVLFFNDSGAVNPRQMFFSSYVVKWNQMTA